MYENYAWIPIFIVGLTLFFSGLWEFFIGPLDTTPEFTAPAPFFEAHLIIFVGFGILITVLAAVPYRRMERWAWYALWVLPAVMLGVAAMNYPVGGTLWPNQL